MMNGKKRIALIAGAAAVVLCVAILLFSCNGTQAGPVPETTAATTEAAQETTQAATEPAQTTEATTEPTGETTEPTEEATQPTTGGSGSSGGSNPGGTGGFTGGEGATGTGGQSEVKVPEPGTEANPYTRNLADMPASFTTLKIPAKGSLSYLINGAQGNCLTIYDEAAQVTYEGKTYKADSGELVLTIPAQKEAGPVLVTFVNGAQEEKALEVLFQAPAGSEGNPIVIDDLALPVQITAKPGETVYYSVNAAGWTMTIEDAADLEARLGEAALVPDAAGTIQMVFPADSGTGRPGPSVFRLTHKGQTEKTYTLAFQAPLGSLSNPAPLVIGDNEITLAANSPDGYHYFWMAEAEGTLTVSMLSQNWQYMLSNETTGVYGTCHLSDEDPQISAEAIAVAAGDRILLMVNTYTPGEWDTPAGTLQFTAALAQREGTQSNPIRIDDLAAAFPTEIPAGEQLYYTGMFHGTTLEIDNVQGLSLVMEGQTVAANTQGQLRYTFPAADGMGRPQPLVFALHNGSQAVAVCSLSFVYPAGSLQNPAELVMGENTATLSADATDGYQFVWYAKESGEISVTMPQGDWQYMLSNVTANVYGELCCSDDETPVPTGKVAVNKGDQVTLMVNTYTPGAWTTPAGTLTVQAAFQVYLPLGTMDNPEPIPGTTAAAAIAAGAEPYHFVYTATGDGTLTVAVDMEKSCESWSFLAENQTSGIYGTEHTYDEVPPVTEETLEVKTGDLVHITLGTYNPEDPWSNPEGQVAISLTFTPASGEVTEVLKSGRVENSSMPVIATGELDFDGSVTLNIQSVTLAGTGTPADYTLNASRSDTTSNTVSQHSGGETVTVTIPVTAGVSYTWGITETAWQNVDVEYALTYTHADMSHVPAKGTLENPKVLTSIGYVSAELAAGDPDGYHYAYTATADGYVAFSAGEGLALTLTNQTTGRTDSLWKTNREGKDIQAAPCFVSVKKGETVLIHVTARNPGAAASGNLFGTQANGTTTEGQGINLQTDDYMATLLPGETVNFTCRFNGRIVTFYGHGFSVHNRGYHPSTWATMDNTYTDTDGDGVMVLDIYPTGDYCDVTVTNTGDEAATFEIEAVFPLGTKTNPEIIGLGQHTLTSADSNGGWEYAFRPTKSGVVQFTILSHTNGWQYNLDAGVDRFHDDSVVRDSQYITVAQGQDLAIFMGTWSGDSAYRPGGTITFSIEYVENMGTKDSPIPLEGTDYLSTGAIGAGSVQYFALPASAGGQQLSIYDENAYVLAGEKRYDYDQDTWALTVPMLSAAENGSVVVGIGNTSGEARSFGLTLIPPEGSSKDYAKQGPILQDGVAGKLECQIPAGFGSYYWFLPVNSDSGTVTVTMEEAGCTNGWSYQLMTTEYDEMWNPVEILGTAHSSLDGTPVPTDTMAYSGWNGVYLLVRTADGGAGTVAFTVTVTADPE